MLRFKLDKWFFILLTILGMFWFRNNSTNDSQINDGILLRKTFEEMDIKVEKTMLSYSNLIFSDAQADEIHSFADKIQREFSLNMKLTSVPDKEKVITYEGISSSPTKTVQILWVGVPKEGKVMKSIRYTSYLVVKINSSSQNKNSYVNNYNSLSKSLQSLSLNPEIIINMQGNINKKTTQEDREELVETMFKQLNGSISEGLNDKEVISLTGFTNQFNYFFSSKEKPINLQIAARYDSMSEKTRITVGTPVLVMEY